MHGVDAFTTTIRGRSRTHCARRRPASASPRRRSSRPTSTRAPRRHISFIRRAGRSSPQLGHRFQHTPSTHRGHQEDPRAVDAGRSSGSSTRRTRRSTDRPRFSCGKVRVRPYPLEPQAGRRTYLLPVPVKKPRHEEVALRRSPSSAEATAQWAPRFLTAATRRSITLYGDGSRQGTSPTSAIGRGGLKAQYRECPARLNIGEDHGVRERRPAKGRAGRRRPGRRRPAPNRRYARYLADTRWPAPPGFEPRTSWPRARRRNAWMKPQPGPPAPPIHPDDLRTVRRPRRLPDPSVRGRPGARLALLAAACAERGTKIHPDQPAARSVRARQQPFLF